MVLAYHVVFGTYGFWLPNDPRGSWSDFVGSWELFRFGKATKTTTRRSVASTQHDRRRRLEAKDALKFPPVHFTGPEAVVVAAGFSKACEEGEYVVWAASILPEHVHLVVARHERNIEQIVGHLKSSATHLLRTSEHRDAEVRIWASRCWPVFLNTEQDIRRAVRYVEENPLKERKRRQSRSFVTPYSG
jgi:REP element-mobilizing transposase RayT